jgi:hypothetical protein
MEMSFFKVVSLQNVLWTATRLHVTRRPEQIISLDKTTPHFPFFQMSHFLSRRNIVIQLEAMKAIIAGVKNQQPPQRKSPTKTNNNNGKIRIVCIKQ